MIIHNFEDFTKVLQEVGFSMGGENGEGIYSVSSCFGDNIEWHTDNPETDPWEWRMRVLEERDDIAYAKLFFRKSGWITKEWYPYFYAVRRKGMSFDESYEEGMLSAQSKRIYKVIEENERLPFHELKQLAGFSKEDRYQFDKALVELQMKMFITMCGRQQKSNGLGIQYGWSSTVFCVTESFFDNEVLEKAASISEQEAIKTITKQIYKINPEANERKIKKFIVG